LPVRLSEGRDQFLTQPSQSQSSDWREERPCWDRHRILVSTLFGLGVYQTHIQIVICGTLQRLVIQTTLPLQMDTLCVSSLLRSSSPSQLSTKMHPCTHEVWKVFSPTFKIYAPRPVRKSGEIAWRMGIPHWGESLSRWSSTG